MKKLFLLALVAVSINSYGVVVSELVNSGGTGTTEAYGGSGTLSLTSRGEVVDVTNKMYLKITPTASAGPDMTSLEFNFGQLMAGNTGTVNGRFEAQVFKNKAGTDTPVQLTKDNISVGFYDEKSSNIDTNKKYVISDVTVKDSNLSSEPAVPKPIGSVTYTLSAGSGLNNNGFKYVGDIIAEVTIDSEASYTGVFIERANKIMVNITGLDDPTTPAAG